MAAPPGPVWLYGDPQRLAQVLSNLLNNAAKYTPLGGRIELEARRENGELAQGDGVADKVGETFGRKLLGPMQQMAG